MLETFLEVEIFSPRAVCTCYKYTNYIYFNFIINKVEKNNYPCYTATLKKFLLFKDKS